MADPIKKERAPASAPSNKVTNINANLNINRALAIKPQGTDLEPIIECLPIETLCSGFGQYHTDEPNRTNRVPYGKIRLADIFRMAANPSTRPKPDARWFIPSKFFPVHSRASCNMGITTRYGLILTKTRALSLNCSLSGNK